MAHDFCWWCSSKIDMPDDYVPDDRYIVCSWTCYEAESLFSLYFSDEEQKMRSYWKGERYGIPGKT